MQFSFTLSPHDWNEAQQQIIAQVSSTSRFGKAKWTALGIFAWFLIGLGFAFLRAESDYLPDPVKFEVGLASVALGLLLLCFYPYWFKANFRKAVFAERGLWSQTQHWSLLPDCLEISTEKSFTRIPWSTFVALRETPSNLFLFLDDCQAAVLPKSVDGSTAHVDFIRTHVKCT